MPVLVDGNNLLHAARDAGTSTLLIGRSMLCDTLGEWARRRNQRVHVVFDGPQPSTQLAAQIGHPNIQVTYSGSGITADDAVLNILEADSATRRILVVSTDREVARAARHWRAQSIRSDEFWATVKRDLARPLPRRSEPEEKEVGLDPEATQQWLEEFGLADSDGVDGFTRPPEDHGG